MHSICLSVHTLILENILKMSSKHILFISDIAWTVLKIVYVGLMVRLQRHTKVFKYNMAYGTKIFKVYFNTFVLH